MRCHKQSIASAFRSLSPSSRQGGWSTLADGDEESRPSADMARRSPPSRALSSPGVMSIPGVRARSHVTFELLKSCGEAEAFQKSLCHRNEVLGLDLARPYQAPVGMSILDSALNKVGKAVWE
jgi:hypothetical protein